jgi:hypothetical protein
MGESAGLRLLEDARSLVTVGWCQGADARDGGGAPVDPWAATAVSWSILGALVAVLEQTAATTGEMPLEQLATALYALADVIEVDSLEQWNDTFGRSQSEVVGALELAAFSYSAKS